MQRAAVLAVVAGLGLSSFALARALVKTPNTPAWPETGATLRHVDSVFPAGFGRRRVYIDAGHGAPGNTGNRNAFCVDEQEFTLGLAEELGAVLIRSDHFDVKLSRSADRLVPYAERVQEAEAWPADVLVSLHSDVRGKTELWQPSPGALCPRSRSAPGYSLLWSDQGESPLVDRRLGLARALSEQLGAAGFLPLGVDEYSPTYAADPSQAGVFVDRHPTSERVFVLWRPNLPSVIVETHNAVDDREALRWRQPETRAAFTAAVMAALVTAL